MRVSGEPATFRDLSYNGFAWLFALSSVPISVLETSGDAPRFAPDSLLEECNGSGCLDSFRGGIS
jgi:hypothetical protein